MKLEFKAPGAPMRGHWKVKAKMVKGIVEDMVRVVMSTPDVLSRFSTEMFMAKLTAMYSRGTSGAPPLPGREPWKALMPAQATNPSRTQQIKPKLLDLAPHTPPQR